ncbi:MAG: hypothetical protein J7M12_04355 [Candidatus Hydrogenedentes bacterium]|nr:hypothetical protein [Candidatus Hydrogenedentota bacterium]
MVRRILVSVGCVVAILLAGVAVNRILTHLKKPPAAAPVEERALHVKATRVEAENVPVTITGYGEARTLNVVPISAEVAGRIVEIHPNLEVGCVIPRGDTLFVIDPRTYSEAVDESRASVKQLENSIARIKTQFDKDKSRLGTLSRSRDLARAEFDRVRKLFVNNKVGTQSGVDAAERAYNAAKDLVDQMERALAVYPIQIREMADSLDAARARLKIAEINLGRTRVVAPFDARVVTVNLEKDQYVGPGTPTPLLTLADDSVLEISVPLDSRDARRWLQFDGERVDERSAWFSGLKRVACTVRWTDDKANHTWRGTLDRVERFDSKSRTLTVAVRIKGADAVSADPDRLPLVDGMFCEIEIPGRTIEDAFRVPSWAVSFKNTVYRSVDGRLRTTPVEVGWRHGDSVYITGGLQEGDIVVTTRLVNPLENSLLDIMIENGETAAS